MEKEKEKRKDRKDTGESGSDLLSLQLTSVTYSLLALDLTLPFSGPPLPLCKRRQANWAILKQTSSAHTQRQTVWVWVVGEF